MRRFLALALLAAASAAAQPTRIDRVAEIAPPAGLDEDARFGAGVTIRGDAAVVTSPGFCGAGDPGTAYVFRRFDTAWSLEQRLRRPVGDATCAFGTFAALADGALVVGANDAAFVYAWRAGQWVEADRVDLSLWGPNAGPRAFDGARMVIQSGGLSAPVVVERDGGAWTATDTLAVPGWRLFLGTRLDGDRIALQGARVIDGVWRSAVAVFERGPDGWGLAFRQTVPPDARLDGLALSGDRLAVPFERGEAGWALRLIERGPDGWRLAGTVPLAPGGEHVPDVAAPVLDGDVFRAGILLGSAPSSRNVLTRIDLGDANPAPTLTPLPDAVSVWSLRLAASGGTVLLADPLAADGEVRRVGAAVALRDGDAEAVPLTVPGAPRNEAWLGDAVAVDGVRVAAVARPQDRRGRASVHVFRTDVGREAWVEVAALGLRARTECPIPVALEGDRLVAGTEGFVWDGTAWAPGGGLRPVDCQSALALDGSRLAQGVPTAADGAGLVTVYAADGDGWRPTATLRGAPDGRGFGHAVALDGGRLVVSSRSRRPDGGFGTVDVFEAQGEAWARTGSLAAPPEGVFGDAVGLGGGWAVAGAPVYVGEASPPEAVRVARGAFGTGVATLASPLPARALFGASVAVAGDRVLVGAPLADVDGAEAVGAAFLFEHDGRAWSEARELPRPALEAGTRFGSAVAVDGQRLLVGAPRDGRAAREAGTVFVYASSFATPSDRAPAAPVAGLSAPSPNPARHRARVVLTPGAPGPARVDLLDALGRHVRTLLDGPVAGPTEVEVPTGGLAAGLYLVRATWAGGAATRTLPVVR